MNSIYIGIDVGGTHTDGVALDAASRRVVHRVKVPTTQDLDECSLAAMEGLLEIVTAEDVSRVVLSTTLVTNALAMGRVEPVGLFLMAGPGMNPDFLVKAPHCHHIRGAMDHRGREIQPIDEEQVRQLVETLRFKGVEILAVAGKFAVRNPSHELRIAELAEPHFDHVCLAHRLSGSLNFPRRAVTAQLAGGVWRRHTQFVLSMKRALDLHGITAPLYLLRADGGAHRADSFRNPAETALSGPAASIMGTEAMDSVEEETLTLDIGGTTCDISMFVKGAPLLEPAGATIGPHKTQIRSLFNRSVAIGGDSVVRVRDGSLAIGPDRRGPAAAFGGPSPTPTDALVVLGRTSGSRDRATESLAPVAEALGLTVETASLEVIEKLAHMVGEAARAYTSEVNGRPVYTIRELLAGHKVKPVRAVIVGGPARAIAPYVERELGLPVHVGAHFDVANAVGAAVARVNLEVNALADTAEGRLTIPEAGVCRNVGSGFTLAETRRASEEALAGLAREKGLAEEDFIPETVEEESFRIVEGYSARGSVHRLRMQVRPSILFKVES